MIAPNSREGRIALRLAALVAAHTLRTRVEKADDRLSRAASAVQRVLDAHFAYDHFDRAFDGGEFSGPALARALRRDVAEALEPFGFTPATYDDALAARLSAHAAFHRSAVSFF